MAPLHQLQEQASQPLTPTRTIRAGIRSTQRDDLSAFDPHPDRVPTARVLESSVCTLRGSFTSRQFFKIQSSHSWPRAVRAVSSNQIAYESSLCPEVCSVFWQSPIE